MSLLRSLSVCLVCQLPVSANALDLQLPSNAKLLFQEGKAADSTEIAIGPFANGDLPELEAEGAYREDKHDALFKDFGDGNLGQEELSHFPDYLIRVSADRLQAAETDRLMEMLSAGLPAKKHRMKKRAQRTKKHCRRMRTAAHW